MARLLGDALEGNCDTSGIHAIHGTRRPTSVKLLPVCRRWRLRRPPTSDGPWELLCAAARPRAGSPPGQIREQRGWM